MTYGLFEERLKEITYTLQKYHNNLTNEQILILVDERKYILENLKDVEDLPL